MKRADWLIWVTRLVFLRSRLLFASKVERRDAEKEAHRTVAHLDELLRIRAAATWLEERPQLGVTTFARGCSDLANVPRGRQASYFGLMEACLGVLERELARFDERDPIYAINVPAYWTITDALARIREKLSEGTFQSIWRDCIPFKPSEDMPSRKAAIAGAFVAGLELVKQGSSQLKLSHFPRSNAQKARKGALPPQTLCNRYENLDAVLYRVRLVEMVWPSWQRENVVAFQYQI